MSLMVTILAGVVMETLVFKKSLAVVAISFDLGPVINCHLSFKIHQ